MSDSTNVSVRPAGAGQVRRRAAALKDPNKPLSTRAAGAGGSSNTMMRLYTSDDTPGLRVDPLVVLSLAIAFILSVVVLHLSSKAMRYFTK